MLYQGVKTFNSIRLGFRLQQLFGGNNLGVGFPMIGHYRADGEFPDPVP
jgi:hypothetical protein